MYQALYRKWRPRVFEDVAGQPHITTTLKNELIAGRIAHAYLFTGSRGTGKTTCAKILAKAVNCLNLQNGDPCNECENCRGIDSGSILDVVEIDAASNNGVDNIRDLREEAVYSPASAKYRVYIIDEAHMLSGGAFNALLKTLEEPPAYVIFILATTEVHKLPATILSRCQRFDFRRIPANDIAARLCYVARQEALSLTPAAAGMIARLSDGAMRDALSLLDRCAGMGNEIGEDIVSQAAGLSGREYLFSLADAAIGGDYASALKTVDRLYGQSKDVERLCEELIGHFRNLMLLKSSREAVDILSMPPDDLARLKTQAETVTIETVLHALDTLQHTLETLRRSSTQRVELEMGLLRLCSPELDNSASSLLRRIAALESRIASGIPAAVVPRETRTPSAAVQQAGPAQTEQDTKPSQVEPDAQVIPVLQSASEPSAPAAASALAPPAGETEESTETALSCWPEVLQALGALDAPLKGVLNGSSAVLRGDHVLVDSSNSMFAELIRKAEHQKPLLEAVRQTTGKPYKVGIFKKSLRVRPAEHDAFDELIKNAKDGGLNIIER